MKYMSSEVYFIRFGSTGYHDSVNKKIQRLYDECNIGKILNEEDIVAIKLHFGEKGNSTYINPTFVREIVDQANKKKVNPFLTDTNTLYSGERNNSIKHINNAVRNGFAYSVVNAPIIIADGINSKNYENVSVNLKHFKNTKIAGEIYNSDSMIVLSHFKGHELAGFGGAIKNLSMGCATVAGKQQQHSSLKPKIKPSRCIGCGLCVSYCNKDAIAVENKIAYIDKEKCIGCGECVAICKRNAIIKNWKTDSNDFLEKMAEYAFGAVKNKKDKVAYINFIVDVTPLCDCCGWSGTPIVNNVGIAASFDPVALDKASYDLVNEQIGNKNSDLKCNYESGEDKFRGLHPDINAEYILEYSELIGLGSKKYKLIVI